VSKFVRHVVESEATREEDDMAPAEQAGRLLELGEKARQELERRLRWRDLTPRERERLEMVKAAALGQDLGAIGAWTGRSERTVRRWLGQSVRQGLDALADAPRSGRPARATPAALQALETAVETPPATLGMAFDVWTSARLAAYLEQQTGVRLSAAWVRAVLHQRGWVCGRPKHTLTHLQNATAVAASRAELAAVGKKVRAAPEHSELHFQDETHLETNPHLCRRWHRRGQQATLPSVGINRRVTVFGSVEALGRGRIELVRAAQESAGFVRYLELLEAHHQAVGRQM
jgi:transposase